MSNQKTITGTKEWAKKNLNVVNGCSHDCRYCYAREMAVRYHRATIENWSQEEILTAEADKRRYKTKGTPAGGMDVMFPTTHDLTPGTLEACLTALGHILVPGNSVLITSKPHLDCIRAVCDRFAAHNQAGTNLVMFRFTIGAMDDEILRYWDRNAPTFMERFAALGHAYRKGFRTSVSVEPMLDSDHVVELYHKLKPYVTNSIWIGKMNYIRKRVIIETPEDQRMVERIEAGQTADRVKAIYAALKDEPLVRWKESFKKVLGLPMASEAGEDK